VTKISPRDNGRFRLKAAAQYAASGDIHDVVSELWRKETSNKEELIVKVNAIYFAKYAHFANF
jgi:Xaa-Pro aminopeptidase